MSDKSKKLLSELAARENPENKAGMSRFGINTEKAFGISIPVLREIAKKHREDHALALELWASGFHEARILASMVDDPAQCSEVQMEAWVKEFNSWDICDQVCMGLFAKTGYAIAKAAEWTERGEEFVRRAGFALMAALSLKSSKATDKELLSFLPLIKKFSGDDRNFVRKAVNWALRQIGKRNAMLNAAAAKVATELMNSEDKTARWIGKDAYRELTGEAVRKRLDII